MPAKHLIIRGQVQGVGFRMHTCRVARELGVTGWVRNRSDGSVEAVVAGPRDSVERMITWARRGPERASVTGLEISDEFGEYAEFERLPTL